MPSPVGGVPHVVESCQRWLRSYYPDFHFASRLRTNIPPVASAGDILGISSRCASPKYHPGEKGSAFYVGSSYGRVCLAKIPSGGKRPDLSRPYVLNFRACD